MFFIYMWNNWNMAECDKAFGPEGAHAWSKYCQFYHVYGSHGAISAFYASLSDRYREMLLETMGGDREEALSQILRYYKEFYKDPDFCIAQYGNLLVYSNQVYNFYYQHDYRCVLRMSVEKRWQVGYVARRLLKENGLI